MEIRTRSLASPERRRAAPGEPSRRRHARRRTFLSSSQVGLRLAAAVGPAGCTPGVSPPSIRRRASRRTRVPSRSSSAGQARRRRVGGDGQGFLMDDGPGVEAVVDPVDAHARPGRAVVQLPEAGGHAAIGRQQALVDIDRTPLRDAEQGPLEDRRPDREAEPRFPARGPGATSPCGAARGRRGRTRSAGRSRPATRAAGPTRRRAAGRAEARVAAPRACSGNETGSFFHRRNLPRR